MNSKRKLKDIQPTTTMSNEEIKKFVKKWMEGHEPDTFIPNKHGQYIYSAGPVSLNIVAYFEMLLEDYVEQQDNN